MFDRIALINLDRRVDRLGAFKAKIASYPELHSYTRYRAIHGDTVSVPGFFISGGGAWGCRQSHLRVLEDAMLDGISTLLVLEDDVCFCPNFSERLRAFLAVVPEDWQCLMIGGQNHGSPPPPTGIAGVMRSVNTQRTHAYILRGREAMQELYRLWVRTDRHIDHVFGHFQTRVPSYQPDPFLCGQDEGSSDISGRQDAVRYWSAPTNVDDNTPITILVSDRQVAARLRRYGLHFGHDRCGKTGRDKGLIHIEAAEWPADQLSKWAQLICSEAHEGALVPALWHSPMPNPSFLAGRIGRPSRIVEASSVESALEQLPALQPHYRSSRAVYCWRGGGTEILEGLAYHRFHRGYYRDEVTGIDQGLRRLVSAGNYHGLRSLVAMLRRETDGMVKGRVLLAHPELDVERVRESLVGEDVVELKGTELLDLLQQAEGAVP